MPNMTTLESLNLYAAAIDFSGQSASSRPDEKYGRVHHWIAHNEVDAGWVWTNAGIKTPLRFMDVHVESMRLLLLSGPQVRPCIRKMFITLTRYWQSRHNEYCYPSAQLLELLVDYTQAEGDFKWGVAHHPYPPSRCSSPDRGLTIRRPSITTRLRLRSRTWRCSTHRSSSPARCIRARSRERFSFPSRIPTRRTTPRRLSGSRPPVWPTR